MHYAHGYLGSRNAGAERKAGLAKTGLRRKSVANVELDMKNAIPKVSALWLQRKILS